MAQMACFSYFHTISQFRIPKSEIRSMNFGILNSEFGIQNCEEYVVWASGIISIFHVCMVWIEKYVTRVTDRHHEACRVMPNSDPEWQIFLSTPYTHDRYFFLHTFDTPHLIFKVELALK